MEDDTIHPDLARAFAVIPALPFQWWSFRKLMRTLNSLTRRGSARRDIQVTTVALKDARMHIYRPLDPVSGAALLWMHGGGYIVDEGAADDAYCASCAANLHTIVISIEYRLAPEHPFPAALEDCFAAWQYLQDAATKLGIDPHRIAVAGRSAGGGLAAALCQRIRDAGGTQPAAQLLTYPMLDDRTAADTTLDKINHALWNNTNNRFGWTAYLGQSPGADSAPQYSVPARTPNLAGLPPTWIGVGTVDLFFAEGQLYAQRLQAAGVACEWVKVDGAPHVFDMVVPNAAVSLDFAESSMLFLRQALHI